jgi:hypothetical protein
MFEQINEQKYLSSKSNYQKRYYIYVNLLLKYLLRDSEETRISAFFVTSCFFYIVI